MLRCLCAGTREDGVARAWLGKGERDTKLKLVVLNCFVLLALHVVTVGETCRQRGTSQAGKYQLESRITHRATESPWTI